MSFADELNGLPSAANGLTQAHLDVLTRLHSSGDRGGFYMAYMTMLSQMRPTSNTDQAVIDKAIFQVQMQAHISTYSGFIGGGAPVMRVVLS